MPKKLRVACIQINAGSDVGKNFQRVGYWLNAARKTKARLLALPENFLWRGASKDLKGIAERSRQLIAGFRDFARAHRVALLLGSILESAPWGRKFYNTSVLISETGGIAARYRKIHLFDVALRNVKMRESSHIAPGKKIVVGQVFGIKTGLTVCYDLRFPELFRRLTFSGSRFICVPSNFTQTTGKAHWEVLLRSRAIENQVFILAPAQTGVHPSTGIRSFGNSLVIDPWGEVLAQAGPSEEGIITADLDLGFQERLRKALPSLKHARLKT